MQNMAMPGTGIDFSRMNATGVPSYEDIMSGKDMLRFEKVPVRFSDFHAKIFDMTVPEDVEEYSRLILEIMQGAQTHTCVLLKHETKPMRCRNGEEGWKNYIEWAKYELNDSLVRQIREADRKEEEASGASGGHATSDSNDGVFATL